MRWIAAAVLVLIVAAASRIDVQPAAIAALYRAAADRYPPLAALADALMTASTLDRPESPVPARGTGPVTVALEMDEASFAPDGADFALELRAEPALLHAVPTVAATIDATTLTATRAADSADEAQCLTRDASLLAAGHSRLLKVVQREGVTCRVSCASFSGLPRAIGSDGSPKSMNFIPWKKIEAGYHPSSGWIVARPSRS